MSEVCADLSSPWLSVRNENRTDPTGLVTLQNVMH